MLSINVQMTSTLQHSHIQYSYGMTNRDHVLRCRHTVTYIAP